MTWHTALPQVVYDEHPEFLKLYDFAWECAHKHVVDLPGMPQTPYMDEAFCKEFIWVWDTCFMALFCKYAQPEFPGYQSLKNFYEPLHGTEKLPYLTVENDLDWTGYSVGDRVRMKICHGSNPPLFAWSEHANAMFHGSREHLRTLLLEKQYLQKHFEWLETVQDTTPPECVFAPVWWRKDGHGYHWEGGSSGMDNTPRGRVGEHAFMPRPNNPDMLWLDAICQQALSARLISEMAEIIGEKEMALHWQKTFESLKDTVNAHYWNEEKGSYFDSMTNGERHEVLTIASFWPLLAGIASPEQAEKQAHYLLDPETLGGAVPAVSLSRNDPDFNGENGMYWRGSMWLPTAYMALKAIGRYGMHDLAREFALRIIGHMSKTFEQYSPHSIWECYNPNKPEPARSCDENNRIVRPDFCGWSALGPIALLIEDVIGIYSVDAFKNEVAWDLPEHVGKLGICNLSFGGNRVDLLSENGLVTVRAAEPFTLILAGEKYAIPSGETVIPAGEK